MKKTLNKKFEFVTEYIFSVYLSICSNFYELTSFYNEEKMILYFYKGQEQDPLNAIGFIKTCSPIKMEYSIIYDEGGIIIQELNSYFIGELLVIPKFREN